MTQPDTEGRVVHPLWEPDGFYQLATRETRSGDGGRQRVVQFFHMLHRRGLREAWEQEVPQEVQDWGLPGRLNEDVHSFLRRNYEHAQAAAAERQEAAHQYAGSAMPTPALVVARLDSSFSGGVLTARRGPDFLFSGIGQGRSRSIESFEVNIPGLPARHRYLLLILTLDLINRLAGRLQLGEPGTEDEALAVLAAALRWDTLSHSSPAGADVRRAAQIAGLLALAPALEGQVNVEGRCQETIDLGRPCPTLEPWTWVVVCVGPRDESDE